MDPHNIVEENSGSVWINEQRLGLIHLVDGRLVEQVSWEIVGGEEGSRLTAIKQEVLRTGVGSRTDVFVTFEGVRISLIS